MHNQYRKQTPWLSVLSLFIALSMLLSCALAESEVIDIAPASVAETSDSGIADGSDAVTSADPPISGVEDIPPTTDIVVTPEPVVTEIPATPIPEEPLPTEAPLPEETLAPVEDILGYTRETESPMDVRDLLRDMAIIPESLLTEFSIEFIDSGDSVQRPSIDAKLELSFTIHLPQGVPAQLRAGDWYMIELPDTVTHTDITLFELTQDGIEYAVVEAESGPLRIKFTENVQMFDSLEDRFTIQMRFVSGAYAPGETVTFALRDEEVSPFTFTMASEDGSIIDEGTDDTDLDDATPEEIELIAEEILDIAEEDGLDITIIPTSDAVEPGMGLLSRETRPETIGTLEDNPAPLDISTMVGIVPAADVGTLDPGTGTTSPGQGTLTDWTRTNNAPMDVKDIYDELGITPDSILDGIHLVYQEPNSNTISDTEATVNAAIDFTMNIAIPSSVTQNMREGDTYVVQLPPEVDVLAGDTYELHDPDDPDGPSYATVVVSKDGTVVFTFHSGIETLGDATGTFHFAASFDKTVITTPGDHVIQVPDEPSDQNVTVNIKSNKDQSVDKSGTPDKSFDPSMVTWDVDFNKTLGTLTNATLSDTIPAGLHLDAVEVYTVDVDVDGNVLDGSETALAGYTADLSTGTVTLPSPISSAVRVRYITSITEDTSAGGSFTFTNNATLSADGLTPLTGTASVTAKYGNLIEKENGSYDSEKQEFTWKILYNYGNQEIPESDAFLTDTINGPGMVFDQDSIEIHAVTIDDEGNATVGGVIPSSEYTPSFSGNQMVIQFNHDVNQAYLITYTTHIEGTVDQSGITYSNDVTTTWGGNSHGSGTTTPSVQRNIKKTLQAVDDVNLTLTWTVQINLSRYTMNNWRMTDNFGTGLYLVNPQLIGLVDLDDGNAALTLNQDYTVDVASNNKTFTVTLIGDYARTDHAFEMVYYSSYDNTAPEIVTNGVTSTWTDDDGEPHSSSDSANYIRKPVDYNNGAKYGSYNATTKEITWSILVNYHQVAFLPATLVDPIQGDQQYIPGSVTLYQDLGNGNLGTVLDPSLLGLTITEPSAANNQTLTVEYDGSENDLNIAFWVTFKTTLEGQVVNDQSTYTNNAVLTVVGNEFPLTGTVTVNHGGSLVEKSGEQGSDGYVYWSTTLNPSQSTLQNAVVTDTPSENQRIDMSTFVIYHTTVDDSGNITTDTSRPLMEGAEFTASYAQDSSGTWVLTVSFPGTISTAFVMEYRASVYMTELTGTVENDISIQGTHDETVISGSTTDESEVRVHEGGGTIYGTRGSVTLRKVDQNGQLLAGAVLALKDANDTFVKVVTVDATGTATFSNIPQGTYRVVELSAPEGYTVSPALAAGITVTVDASTTNGTRVITLQNTPTEAMLRKTNEAGQTLAGAVFHLEVQDGSGGWSTYGTETYTSGGDGMVRVIGLPDGTYRFVEDTAPDGYVHNTETPSFTLTAGANGIVPIQDLGDFINYQYALAMKKVDENGQPLAGAVFSVHSVATGLSLGTFTSGADGMVEITGLGPGQYLIREIMAPLGYGLTSDPMVITLIDDYSGPIPVAVLQDFDNSPATGGIVFHKFDGDTGLALTGATFRVTTADGEFVTDITLNSTGDGYIGNLAMGDYLLTEISAPEGYILNTQVWPFTVTDDSEGSTSAMDLGAMDNYRGKVHLIKVDDRGDPVAGAVFTLTNASGQTVGTYTTNTSGELTISGLAPGTYTLTETGTPANYEREAVTFTLTIPDEYEGDYPLVTLHALNHLAIGEIIFRKVDGDTGTGLAGAVFELTRVDTGDSIGTVTTDSTGQGSFTGLVAGEYILTEITAPSGYVLDTKTYSATVTIGEDSEVIPFDVGAVPNYQGRVSLAKVDEAGNPVPGVTFTLLGSNGRSIGTYKSDTTGIVEIYLLPPGTYTVRETAAPPGYQVDNTPISFTIPSSADGEVPMVTLGNVVNHRVTGLVTIRKVDADTGAPLAGAVFQLLDQNGNEITRVTTDQNGEATVTNLSPGTYHFVEISAPYGYQIEDEPLDFIITQSNQLDYVEVISHNRRIPGYPTPTPSPRPTVSPNGPPRTGDSGSGPWGFLLAASATFFAAGLAGFLYSSRRRKGAKSE